MGIDILVTYSTYWKFLFWSNLWFLCIFPLQPFFNILPCYFQTKKEIKVFYYCLLQGSLPLWHSYYFHDWMSSIWAIVDGRWRIQAQSGWGLCFSKQVIWHCFRHCCLCHSTQVCAAVLLWDPCAPLERLHLTCFSSQSSMAPSDNIWKVKLRCWQCVAAHPRWHPCKQMPFLPLCFG